MLQKCLIIFYIVFNFEVLSSEVKDSTHSKQHNSFEYSQNPYTVIEHPDFAFKNFDLDILEKDTEEEEITERNTRCNKEKGYIRDSTLTQNEEELSLQPLEWNSFPPNDISVYEEFTDIPYQNEIPTECEKDLFDVIHNNPRTFHDIENVRHINKNRYNFNNSHDVL